MRISLLSFALLASCASTSIRDDVDRVEALTKVELPDAVTASDVELATSQDVADLLKQPMTADTAVRIALLNNRELRGTLRDLGVERGELVQAGLLPNPTVAFDIRDPGAPGLPLQQDYYVEYELTRALLTPLRTAVAKADLEAARYHVAGSVVAVSYRARIAFFALLAAEQRLRIVQRGLEALAAARDAAQALHDAGNIPLVDLASEIATYEDARARAAELELEALERREELQALLGVHGAETQWTLGDGFPALPEGAGADDDVERRAVTASFQLAEVRSRLEAIAKRTGLARAEGWWPDITVDGHIEQDQTLWEKGAGASIRVPLFDRNQGTVARHEAEFDGLMERYQGLAIGVRSAARRSRNRLLSAFTRAKQYAQTIVPARAEVMRQTMLQYNAMQVGVFAVLQARGQELDSQLAYVETLRDYWSAKAGFDALLAGHVPGEN